MSTLPDRGYAEPPEWSDDTPPQPSRRERLLAELLGDVPGHAPWEVRMDAETRNPEGRHEDRALTICARLASATTPELHQLAREAERWLADVLDDATRGSAA